jgi:hypothetical protein
MRENDGEWHDVRETYFWHDHAPFRVKYEIEKLTGILLARDASTPNKLIYRGDSNCGGNKHNIELRFEAVLPRAPYIRNPPTEPGAYRNLFLLRVESAALKKRVSEAEFLRDAGRTFEYWTLRLQCGSQRIEWQDASREFYAQQMRDSIERERDLARRVEDPDPILAIQKAVLAALREGKRFSTAHKEGGTILRFNGKVFERSNYGEDTTLTQFATDQEMIASIRAFYDWESRRDSYPHRPPELEVWKYIQRQLR